MRKRIPHPKSTKPTRSIGVLVLTIVLTVLGLLVILDVSTPTAAARLGDPLYFVKEQALAACVGVVSMLVCMKLPLRLWKQLAIPLFFVSIILLVAVLIPGISSRVLGARRWVSIAGFVFQPSEIVKFTLALYLARVAQRGKSLLAYVVPLAGVVGLIMLEPDLGTALVVTAIGTAALFISGVELKKLGVVMLAGVICVGLLAFSSPYRRARIETFIEHSADPLGASYHVRQILYSLGSGGIGGVGIGHSRQKHLFLPESTTDSVFAIIAEEVGFVGSVALLGLFGYYLLKLFKTATGKVDTFARTYITLIAVWISAQTMLNIGSMTVLVPLTGIPLPFLSYGGTSLVILLSAIGLVTNIANNER